jgi:hypothetical protein
MAQSGLTGRRPEDILNLPLDCLARDKDGGHVLKPWPWTCASRRTTSTGYETPTSVPPTSPIWPAMTPSPSRPRAVSVSSTSSTDRTRAAIQARRGTIEAMQNRVRVALRQMRRERARVTVAAVARRADVVGPPGAAARSRIWQIGP